MPFIFKMISDQLQECQSCFTSEHGPFDVQFKLQPIETEKALLIELRNKTSPQYFQLVADHQYIKEQKDLSFCFQSPQDLFYTLTELFEELILQSDGTITFQMKLNASKLKKKVIKIQLNKYELDQQAFMKLKFQKLSSEIKNELHQRQARMRVVSQKTQEQNFTLDRLQQQVKDLRKEQETLCLENKRQYFKINNLTKDNQHQRAEIGSLKRQLDLALNKLNTMEFFCFYQNPHWHHFGVVKTQNSFKVIKKDTDGYWCSFIYNIPLQTDRINGFKIRQTKSAQKHIMYGIGTRQIFGINASYKDPSAISYSANSGNLWEGGNSKKLGPPINEGQIITMEINMATKKMFWEVDNVKIAKTVLAETFQKRDIYLFLHFYNIGDEIQLLIF